MPIPAINIQDHGVASPDFFAEIVGLDSTILVRGRAIVEVNTAVELVIEHAAAADSLIAREISNELAHLLSEGDTSSDDPYLSLLDGVSRGRTEPIHVHRVELRRGSAQGGVIRVDVTLWIS